MLDCIDIAYDRGAILTVYMVKLLIRSRLKSVEKLHGILNKNFS
jgi:hypothetical protein